MGALLRSASVGAITLFTEDLERAKLFYSDVFGLPVAFEDEDSAVFKFDNTVINLLKIPAARDLIAPGTVASREAGARVQLTIEVHGTAELKSVEVIRNNTVIFSVEWAVTCSGVL